MTSQGSHARPLAAQCCFVLYWGARGLCRPGSAPFVTERTTAVVLLVPTVPFTLRLQLRHIYRLYVWGYRFARFLGGS